MEHKLAPMVVFLNVAIVIPITKCEQVHGCEHLFVSVEIATLS